MKQKIRQVNLAIIGMMLLTAFTAVAQNKSSEKVFQKGKITTLETQKHELKNKIDLLTYSYLPSRSILETTDTLNYPLAGEYALYLYEGGYVSGNNDYGDLAKANFFENNQPGLLNGVLIDFGWATTSDVMIEIAVWDNNGIGNSPGTKLANTVIPLDNIFIDVLNEVTTFVPFDSPVSVTSDFYVGAYLPSGADTIAIYTNTDGDTDPATAWELWSSGDWYPYDDPESWDFKVSHAIFPIIQTELGVVANFFAGQTAVNPGQTVEFFDTSIGDPVSWEWTFEGGNPAVSSEQNPQITYEEEGLFDVTLVTGDGETSDTLTRQDYILVTDNIPVEIDTLLFPLDGTYIIYVLNDDQGYVCGTNSFGDLAKANYYANFESILITGIIYDFLWATGGNPDVKLAVYNNNGPGGSPGNELFSSSVELNTIKSNISNQMMTYIPVDPPVSLDNPFYAGFELPTAAGDTLVVWSNSDGDTDPGIAWEWWQDGSWYPFSTPPSWELNIALGIHPIVEYVTGTRDISIADQFVIYPNPVKDKLSIITNKMISNADIEIIDLRGSVLGQFSVKGKTTQLDIDLSNYQPGIYFVKLETSEGIIKQKIIKY